MLDTIKHVIRDFEIDQRLVSSRPHTIRGAFGTITRNFKRLSEDKFNLSIFENQQTHEKGAVVETSVPKFLFGSNLYETEDSDLEAYARELSENLSARGLFTTPESVENSEVRRVDFCRNLPFRGDTGAYLNSLSKVTTGFRSENGTIKYSNMNGKNGFQILVENKSFRSSMYEKLIEAGNDSRNSKAIQEFLAAYPDHSLLRLEKSLEIPKAIRRELAKYGRNTTLKEVWCSDLARQVLSKTFEKDFNHGKILPDSLICTSNGAKLDPKVKGMLYYIKEEGFEAVLTSLKTAYSKGKYYREKNRILPHLRDPTYMQPESVTELQKYFENFNPILKPPICGQ